MDSKNIVSWLPEIESNIDSRVIHYLNQYHEEYQRLRKAAQKLAKEYADLFHRMEMETGEITLTAKEKQAYVEYQQIRFSYEGIERQYFYLIGQADWLRYNRLLEQLSQDQGEN